MCRLLPPADRAPQLCLHPSSPVAQDQYFEAVPRFALRAGPRATIYYQPQVGTAGREGAALCLACVPPRQPPSSAAPAPLLPVLPCPSQNTRIAIVTDGGICPGLNDVVRGLVLKVGWGLRWGGAREACWAAATPRSLSHCIFPHLLRRWTTACKSQPYWASGCANIGDRGTSNQHACYPERALLSHPPSSCTPPHAARLQGFLQQAAVRQAHHAHPPGAPPAGSRRESANRAPLPCITRSKADLPALLCTHCRRRWKTSTWVRRGGLAAMPA